MLTATPNVPIYYTDDGNSTLVSGAFTADSAKTYNAATGVPIPAGCAARLRSVPLVSPGLPVFPGCARSAACARGCSLACA
jgi:hypothetical protein